MHGLWRALPAVIASADKGDALARRLRRWAFTPGHSGYGGKGPVVTPAHWSDIPFRMTVICRLRFSRVLSPRGRPCAQPVYRVSF